MGHLVPCPSSPRAEADSAGARVAELVAGSAELSRGVKSQRAPRLPRERKRPQWAGLALSRPLGGFCTSGDVSLGDVLGPALKNDSRRRRGGQRHRGTSLVRCFVGVQAWQ